jgi:DNA primase
MVWPAEGRFKCFGCGVGGDVIEFVKRAEGCDFRSAVARLGGGFTRAGTSPTTDRLSEQLAGHRPLTTGGRPPISGQRSKRLESSVARTTRPRRRPLSPTLDDEAVAILDAAADAYHHLFLATPWVQQSLASRGVNLDTARIYRIGYSDGRRLVPALNRRGLPVQRARELGLLTGWGERFARRITFPVEQACPERCPELVEGQSRRAGRTAFMMGRRTRETDEPKYLGLPRPKPLYLGGSSEARESLVVEGPFDLWLLHEWGYGAQYGLVALLEALPTAAHLAHLRGYGRLFVCLDNDEAGRLGTAMLRDKLGHRVQPVPLPPEVHDVGDLGSRPADDDAVRQFRTILADLVR